MTVAPSIPVASSTVSVPSKRGTSPATARLRVDAALQQAVEEPDQDDGSMPVIVTSNGRAPRRCTPSRPNATTAVMTPPASSGRPNSSCSAIAPPSTSARSVAIATSSACTHSPA